MQDSRGSKDFLTHHIFKKKLKREAILRLAHYPHFSKAAVGPKGRIQTDFLVLKKPVKDFKGCERMEKRISLAVACLGKRRYDRQGELCGVGG